MQLNRRTLFLIILCKWFEMLYQFCTLGFLLFALIEGTTRPTKERPPPIYLLILGGILWVLYAFSCYNINLFSNLRHGCKNRLLFKLCSEWPDKLCCRRTGFVCSEQATRLLIIKWVSLGIFAISVNANAMLFDQDEPLVSVSYLIMM